MDEWPGVWDRSSKLSDRFAQMQKKMVLCNLFLHLGTLSANDEERKPIFCLLNNLPKIEKNSLQFFQTLFSRLALDQTGIKAAFLC